MSIADVADQLSVFDAPCIITGDRGTKQWIMLRPEVAAEIRDARESSDDGAQDDGCVCPITLEPFTDPVKTACGITYGRSATERWLRSHLRDPATKVVLPHAKLEPDMDMRARMRARISRPR